MKNQHEWDTATFLVYVPFTLYQFLCESGQLLKFEKLEWGCPNRKNPPLLQPIQTLHFFTPILLGHNNQDAWGVCVKFHDCRCKGNVIMRKKNFH